MADFMGECDEMDAELSETAERMVDALRESGKAPSGMRAKVAELPDGVLGATLRDGLPTVLLSDALCRAPKEVIAGVLCRHAAAEKAKKGPMLGLRRWLEAKRMARAIGVPKALVTVRSLRKASGGWEGV
jgi:hypothetical protein